MFKDSPEDLKSDDEPKYNSLFTSERVEDYVALSIVLIILIIVLVFY